MTTYYNKYMKYKAKYINVKNKLNEDMNTISDNAYNVYAIKNNMKDSEFENKIKNIYSYSSKYNKNVVLNSALEKFINKINSQELHMIGPNVHV